MYLKQRLRRTRAYSFSRALVRETNLNVQDLIYPMFLVAGKGIKQPIAAMPGINRLSLDLLIEEAKVLADKGLQAIALFPVIEQQLKSLDGNLAYAADGLIPEAIYKLTQECKDLGVIADVALDPYTSHGQDGILDSKGYVANDLTVTALVKQALTLAQAGAKMIAPSDMMDGRVAAIRNALEENSYHNVQILSYAAKYASSFYGPFREAIASSANLKGANKFSYQLDPANRLEAYREVELDIKEGADIVMVKPGLPYLDVIREIKDNFKVPVFAYQVSGEYAMLKAAINNGWLHPQDSILESLLCFKRAGSDAIVSYFCKEIIDLLTK